MVYSSGAKRSGDFTSSVSFMDKTTERKQDIHENDNFICVSPCMYTKKTKLAYAVSAKWVEYQVYKMPDKRHSIELYSSLPRDCLQNQTFSNHCVLQCTKNQQMTLLFGLLSLIRVSNCNVLEVM